MLGELGKDWGGLRHTHVFRGKGMSMQASFILKGGIFQGGIEVSEAYHYSGGLDWMGGREGTKLEEVRLVRIKLVESVPFLHTVPERLNGPEGA